MGRARSTKGGLEDKAWPNQWLFWAPKISSITICEYLSTVENLRGADVIHIFGIVVHLSGWAKQDGLGAVAKPWRFTTLKGLDPFKGDLLCQVIQRPQFKLWLIKKQMPQNLRLGIWEMYQFTAFHCWAKPDKTWRKHQHFNITLATIAGSQECCFVSSYFQCGWSCVSETSHDSWSLSRVI